MAEMFIIILFLLCWISVHFMAASMFGSQNAFTCI